MTPLAKLTVFARAGDAYVDCIRDRVRPAHKLVIEKLADLPGALRARRPTLPADGFGIDLAGHTGNPLFELAGGEPVDATQGDGVAVLGQLRAMGVTRLRLLGCSIGEADASAAFAALAAAVAPLELQGTINDLLCGHYAHDGLRVTAEASVLVGVPEQDATDEPFPLIAFLDENRRPARETDRRLERTRLQELQAHLAPDYAPCCAHNPRWNVREHRMVLARFAMGERGEVGRGEILAIGDGKLVVLVERRELSLDGTVVEVLYDVTDGHEDAVRQLIAGWP